MLIENTELTRNASSPSQVSQNWKVDTLLLTVSHKSESASQKMEFPIIRSGNEVIDKMINEDLKNRFTDNEYPKLATKEALTKWSAENITYLAFQVNYLKNGIVSLIINVEGCGAYCSEWTRYFTYDLNTGKYLTVNDIVDSKGRFSVRVIADKDKQYEQQKTELKAMLSDKNMELDKETYEFTLSQYESCSKDFALNNFTLYEDRLELVEICELPHAIKNLSPIINLVYRYEDIKAHLKINP